MKALLLAAGLGTRLRPITNNIPKCLVPIAGRPLLDYWLRDLTQAGVEQFIINTHYFSDAVEQFIATHPLRDRIQLCYEPELLGTGGSLKAYSHMLEHSTFILAHADNFVIANWQAFINSHQSRESQVEMMMMTFTTDTPSSCGIVEVDDKHILRAFHEKVATPPSNQASGAIFIMEPSVARYAQSVEEPFFEVSKVIVPHYIGRTQVWHNADTLIDIGTPQSLTKAQTLMSDVLTA